MSAMAVLLKRGDSMFDDPTLSVNIEDHQQLKLNLEHAIFEIENLKSNASSASDSMKADLEEFERSKITLKQLQDSNDYLRESLENNKISADRKYLYIIY